MDGIHWVVYPYSLIMSVDFTLIPQDVSGDDTFLQIGNQHLTYDEFHSAALGLIGLVLGERGAGLRTTLAEPHYFIGVFVLSYLLGRRLSDTTT